MQDKFEKCELNAWSHVDDYLLELLNGETTVEELREDLLSFRNTKHYTGTRDKYLIIKEA